MNRPKRHYLIKGSLDVITTDQTRTRRLKIGKIHFKLLAVASLRCRGSEWFVWPIANLLATDVSLGVVG